MSSSRFQILSLDGGGLKGVFTASFLAQWEKSQQTRIADHFDLIAGTSTGGIIALGLGLGYTAEEILNFYIDEAESIFPSLFLGDAAHLIKTKYSDKGLQTALQKRFGKRRLGESQKRLVIPSYNSKQAEIHLYKTSHHPRLMQDYQEYVWEIARATAAAPSYLKPHATENHVQLIDGGVWANNPVMVALSEALGYLGQRQEDIWALRIGTGLEVVSINSFPDKGGTIKYAKPMIDFMMRSQGQSATSMAMHILNLERLMDVNPRLAPGDFSLDKFSQDLIGFGVTEFRSRSSDLMEKGFFDHRAAEFVPVHKLK